MSYPFQQSVVASLPHSTRLSDFLNSMSTLMSSIGSLKIHNRFCHAAKGTVFPVAEGANWGYRNFTRTSLIYSVGTLPSPFRVSGQGRRRCQARRERRKRLKGPLPGSKGLNQVLDCLICAMFTPERVPQRSERWSRRLGSG